MRIAVIEPVGRGGLMHYAFQLCRGLSEAGVEVNLVTDQSFELEALSAPFDVVRLFHLWDAKPSNEASTGRLKRLLRAPRRALRALIHYREWLRLFAWLRRERPDVVIFGDIRFPGDSLPLRLIRSLGLFTVDICHNVRPFAATRRSGNLVRRGRLREWLFRGIYQGFDLVLVHFERNRLAFVEAWGVPEEGVAVIPHGNEEIFRELADPSLSPEQVRSSLGLGADDRFLLSFGTLTRYKGVDVLIAAAAVAAETQPALKLVVAGFPGPDFDLDAHRELASSLGIGDRILFVPRYVESPEVAAWMEAADLAVLAHRLVFQSGVLHLFHTFGLPTVATRAGAAEDVLCHDETGLLVPADDPQAMGQAIADLLADPERAAALGQAARQDALERFSWEAIGATVVEELERRTGPAERS